MAVAITDRGIDWRNADFRNDDGTTRIACIFELTDDTGSFASGNPYGMGTIYTRAEVDAALSGGLALATRDAVRHGTTTAGLAVGNGRNRPDRRWRGIAPRATLLVVKITSDGAPAHVLGRRSRSGRDRFRQCEGGGARNAVRHASRRKS